MKKLSFALGAVMAFIPAVAQTAGEQPMITFKTNIYDTYGSSNSFHIVLGTTQETYFDIDYGYGPEEVLVGPAVFDEDQQAVTGTAVSMSVAPDGIVKIYGDPSLLDYFDAEGCYLDWIDLGDCTNLDVLDLQHNELKRLDLSRYNKLSAIYLTDNPFTSETPLVIGDDHPDLMILEVDIIDWISPDFDITHYPNLIDFDAYANKSISHLDPTKCPNIRRISVDGTMVASIDVSKNPMLQVLNVADSRVCSLDLSNNPELSQLYIQHGSPLLNPQYKFTSIDLSKNTKLTYLAADGNLLTDIDISNNPLISHLDLSENYLTGIDISTLAQVYYLDLSNNNMGFSTLPLPIPGCDYFYSQRPLPVDRSCKVGTTLDFSAKVLREGTVTDALLYSYDRFTGQSTLLDDSYFSYADGKVTLLKEYSDSVYISFANSEFMEYPMSTERFMVKSEADFGAPSPAAVIGTILAAGKPFDMGVGIMGATTSDPVKFYVDLGDGKRTEFIATGADAPLAPNVASTVKGDGDIIIYMPEGCELTALTLDDASLYSLDLSDAAGLRYLSAANNSLTKIDLSMNSALRYLDLSGNRLTTIDLNGANGTLGKTFLNDVDLSNNRLTELVINDTRMFRNLNLSNNRFAVFDYYEFENMQTFDISGNQLKTLNLAYFTGATDVNVSNNKLTEVRMPQTNVFEHFSIENNCLSLGDLPYLPGVDYTYAPQAIVELPAKGPGADLSSQYRVIDGNATVFTWRLSSDNSIVPDTKISCDKGRTSFIDPEIGSVYCQMTHAAFPAFEGPSEFRTTAIETAAMPTHCVATFTTPVGGQTAVLSLAAKTAGTSIVIDWSGSGYAAEQYQLGTTYRLFESTTIASANVKVLTYSPEDCVSVFSISGVTMSDADLSGLTEAKCINISEAGLDAIKLPENENLLELILDGNNLSENIVNLAAYPNLQMLSINSNKFNELDLTPFKKMQVVGAGYNNISTLKLDNLVMWQLVVSNNNLTEIDLSGVPRMRQISLSSNQIAEIDVDNLAELKDLAVDQNRLTFATLPRIKEQYSTYLYYNQAPLDPAVDDHKCYLSEQADVDGTPTVFRWFIGVPEFDENGELVGEELYQDDEYTIEDGITTFLIKYDGIMCVMTNEAFPNLYLYTNLLSTEDGVQSIAGDDVEISVTLVGGDIVVTAKGVADGTPVALYGIDGRMAGSTTVRGESATIASAPRGHVILSVAGKAFKLNIR